MSEEKIEEKKTPKVSPKMKELVKTELRKGSSNSRIAKLLEKEYEEAVQIIDYIKEIIRPEVGQVIEFTFRDEKMVGTIENLLDNSSVVKIDWTRSEKGMHELLEDKTIVNFKDIEGYL
ncbi:MAG: DUF2187 family protein [Atopococcus tabaci]|uniref:DUF2187 family protein n=1 Tax=Atopococcus tabaci TaxID=269774 RepID=A0AA43RJN2_9LACT|nr:DUF2187 family protein [Atopococcus tabaci]